MDNKDHTERNPEVVPLQTSEVAMDNGAERLHRIIAKPSSKVQLSDLVESASNSPTGLSPVRRTAIIVLCGSVSSKKHPGKVSRFLL